MCVCVWGGYLCVLWVGTPLFSKGGGGVRYCSSCGQRDPLELEAPLGSFTEWNENGQREGRAWRWIITSSSQVQAARFDLIICKLESTCCSLSSNSYLLNYACFQVKYFPAAPRSLFAKAFKWSKQVGVITRHFYAFLQPGVSSWPNDP